jgi:dTDP-4-dehydrorhamnose reductase
MKIGIVGAGQLGKGLFKFLNNDEDSICIYSRQQGFDAKCFETAREIALSNDIVINCAAMTNVDLCETEQMQAVEANVTLPQNLAIACRLNSVPFIHISTDYVYGSNDFSEDGEIDEDYPCKPLNFYGKTKLIADEFICNNSENFLILRPSWLFGEDGENNFIFKMMKKIREAKEDEVIFVVDDEHGVTTSVPTVASTVKMWMKGKLSNGIYNVRDAVDQYEVVSRYDIAVFIKEMMKSNADIRRCSSEDRMMKQVAIRQKNSFLSIGKILEELNRVDSSTIRKAWVNSFKIPHWKDTVGAFVRNKYNKV